MAASYTTFTIRFLISSKTQFVDKSSLQKCRLLFSYPFSPSAGVNERTARGRDPDNKRSGQKGVTMTREFLANLDLGEGVHIPANAIDAIMAEHGKDFTANQNTIQTLTTERDGLKTQLDDANKTIKSYTDMDIDGIKKSASDWEKKYNEDTQGLKDQLAAANYGFSVERAAAGLKFTSEGAKKAFIADLTAKKLQLQEGKLLGFDDYVKAYKESDPGINKIF